MRVPKKIALILATAAGLAGASIFDEIKASSSAGPTGARGFPECSCVESVEFEENDIARFGEWGVPNVSTYGLGCRAHDANTTFCRETQDRDDTYCNRRWCFIDPFKCDRVKKTESPHNPDLFYSYATCGDIDKYTEASLLEKLNGTTLRIGYTKNSGGWTGAYTPKGVHFEGPEDVWYGPAIEFTREAARRAGFNISLVPPNPDLKNMTVKQFSNSTFDLCVYSTALGYSDFCVAQYTVTDKRASVAEWFVIDEHVSIFIYILTCNFCFAVE